MSWRQYVDTRVRTLRADLAIARAWQATRAAAGPGGGGAAAPGGAGPGGAVPAEKRRPARVTARTERTAADRPALPSGADPGATPGAPPGATPGAAPPGSAPPATTPAVPPPGGTAPPGATPGSPKSGDEILDAVEAHLDTANALAGRGGRRAFVHWVRGNAVEGAWFSVHHAEAMLLTVLPDDDVWARIPSVAATARAYLPRNDARRTRLERCYMEALAQCERRAEPLTGEDRDFLADTLRAAYFLNAVGYSRVRAFRNAMLGATLVLAVLVAVLLGIGKQAPSAVPVCFTPPPPSPAAAASPAPTPSPRQICPTGVRTGPDPGQAQTGGDLALVGLVGVLGAALAAARSLMTGNELPTRYSPVIAQALLKLPSGALTAVFGVVALRAGAVPGVETLDDQAAILFWALLFGFAQQTLTGLLDARAQTLLKDAAPETKRGDQ